MKAYMVNYYLDGAYEEERSILSPASNKYEAYDRAVYELIPEKEGRIPFAAWVASVTYNNGNYKTFRSFCGNSFGD